MKIARTAALLTGTRLAVTAVSVFIPVVFVRVLTKAEYGIFKQIDLLAVLLTPALGMGLDASVTYFAPRRERDRQAEISTPVTAVLLVCILFFVAALLLPGPFATVFGADEMRLLVAAIASAATAGALEQIARRALLAVDAVKAAVAVPMGVGLPRPIVLVVVALAYRSIEAVLVACTVLSLAEALFIVLLMRHVLKLRPQLEREVLDRHVRYGGLLWLTAIAKSWAGRIDRYFVTSRFDAATFAVYAVGKTRVPLFDMLPRSIDLAIAPKFSSLESENRLPAMARLWRKRAESLLPLNMLTAAFLCTTAQWLIPIVFTDAYVEAIPIFQIFAVQLVVDAVGGVDLILRALAAVRFLVVTIFLSLGVRIVLCLAVLPLDSLPMLALVQLVVTVVFITLRLVVARRLLHVPWLTILPHEGLGLSMLFVVGGAVATYFLGAVLPLPRVGLLAVATVLWGALLAIALWRQGLWREFVPMRWRRPSEPEV